MSDNNLDYNLVRETFANKYIEYLLNMTHLSKITKFDCYFFQLILFIHEGSNEMGQTYKIKNNCFFVDKLFDKAVTFRNHGAEYQMYTRYIAEYCPDEITVDTSITGQLKSATQSQNFYGCNFKCQTTFKLIAQKLKTQGYTKVKILQLQNELKMLEKENIEACELKQQELKKCIVTTKNICMFIKNVNECVL